MLINEPLAIVDSPIAVMIAQMNGNNFLTFQVQKDQLNVPAAELKYKKITADSEFQEGCYIRGSFGSSPWLDGYSDFPDFGNEGEWQPQYGICDCVQQVLDKITKLQNPLRKFVVMFTPVLKANQESRGGWRFHKWGPYIGEQEITKEYLYDEPGIDGVLCYHVYENIK